MEPKSSFGRDVGSYPNGQPSSAYTSTPQSKRTHQQQFVEMTGNTLGQSKDHRYDIYQYSYPVKETGNNSHSMCVAISYKKHTLPVNSCMVI